MFRSFYFYLSLTLWSCGRGNCGGKNSRCGRWYCRKRRGNILLTCRNIAIMMDVKFFELTIKIQGYRPSYVSFWERLLVHQSLAQVLCFNQLDTTYSTLILCNWSLSRNCSWYCFSLWLGSPVRVFSFNRLDFLRVWFPLVIVFAHSFSFMNPIKRTSTHCPYLSWCDRCGMKTIL